MQTSPAGGRASAERGSARRRRQAAARASDGQRSRVVHAAAGPPPSASAVIVTEAVQGAGRWAAAPPASSPHPGTSARVRTASAAAAARVALAVRERLVALRHPGLRVLAAGRRALAVGVGVLGPHRVGVVDALGHPGRHVVGDGAGLRLVGQGCVAAFSHAPRIPSALVVITFLSDYGTADDFVGVCHAVMARIAPDVRVVDLSHGIARHDLRTGALVLRRTLPFAAPGVHLAVIDPEVGGTRRAVAVRCAEEDRLLVGPDNGLLLPAAERFGGVAEVVEISTSPCRLLPVSATFHGRDLFAPVGAHLAGGVELAETGDPLDPAELVALDLPTARLEGA